MPRRKAQKGVNWNLLFLVVGLPVVALIILGELVGWTLVIAGFCILCGLIFLIKLINNSRRHTKLMEKYGDEDLVKDIEQGYYWKGQTADQLRDALGDPDDFDEEVLKTKVKSIWKYDHRGGNRYGLRINLDDEVVIGWKQND